MMKAYRIMVKGNTQAEVLLERKRRMIEIKRVNRFRAQLRSKRTNRTIVVSWNITKNNHPKIRVYRKKNLFQMFKIYIWNWKSLKCFKKKRAFKIIG